jgi:GMP reductase
MTRILTDVKYDFSDVLILPQRSELSSRSDVSLERKVKFKNSGLEWTGIGVMIANMDGCGTFDMAKVASQHYGLMTCLVKHYTLEELVDFYNKNGEWAINTVCYSLGISDNDINKYKEFKKQTYAKFVTIDVANGYSEKFLEFVKRFRDENPYVVLIAGNVATPEITQQLILSGVDIVKVGIGSGASCSTRLKAGIGVPQLSAIIECADIAHGLGGHIIGDGGINYPADFSKGFAAGADFMMAGSFFAGCDEGGGSIMIDPETGKKYVQFYGMSSATAQAKHGSGLQEYRASEGRVIKVPYKGSVEPVIKDLLGSIRSTLTYTGSKSIKDLPKRATFCLVNRQISTLYGLGELMS